MSLRRPSWADDSDDEAWKCYWDWVFSEERIKEREKEKKERERLEVKN